MINRTQYMGNPPEWVTWQCEQKLQDDDWLLGRDKNNPRMLSRFTADRRSAALRFASDFPTAKTSIVF